jgi:hypothetical protein
MDDRMLANQAIQPLQNFSLEYYDIGMGFLAFAFSISDSAPSKSSNWYFGDI